MAVSRIREELRTPKNGWVKGWVLWSDVKSLVDSGHQVACLDSSGDRYYIGVWAGEGPAIILGAPA